MLRVEQEQEEEENYICNTNKILIDINECLSDYRLNMKNSLKNNSLDYKTCCEILGLTTFQDKWIRGSFIQKYKIEKGSNEIE